MNMDSSVSKSPTSAFNYAQSGLCLALTLLTIFGLIQMLHRVKCALKKIKSKLSL
jgi:hypothetical protein